MREITRRDFVKGSLIAGAALLAPYSRVLGANDDIRVAIVGFHGKGRGHIGDFHKLAGVRVVALCDVDRAVLDSQVKKFTDRNEKVDAYTDVRKLVEDKSIDVIVIATPNHWHALMTVWACQAGKDVYVEKPVSHEIWEGSQATAAARKYNCIVQAGTQNRSDVGLIEAYKYIKEGNLGKIVLVRGFCYKRRKSIGKVTGPQEPPASVDYDLWCGPAPKEPLMRENLHYDWHWVWSTGNGDIGNQGVHEMDLCRWALDKDALPEQVISYGGRLGYIDDGETPNTLVTFFDYKPAPIIFEVRGLPRWKFDTAMDNYRRVRIGVIIQCEGGYFAGGRNGGWVYDNEGKRIKQFTGDGGGGHQANFIKAVRGRKVSDLKADIREGHLSSALCHMSNISYRLGQQAAGGEIREAIKDDKEMLDAFARFQEHLLVNGVDVKLTPRMLGPRLTMDPKAEKFVGDFADEANKFLKRDYRAPFVLPEKI